MGGWKTIFLSKWVICRFHVNLIFQGVTRSVLNPHEKRDVRHSERYQTFSNFSTFAAANWASSSLAQTWGGKGFFERSKHSTANMFLFEYWRRHLETQLNLEWYGGQMRCLFEKKDARYRSLSKPTGPKVPAGNFSSTKVGLMETQSNPTMISDLR